jgi:hypothetical protein
MTFVRSPSRSQGSDGNMPVSSPNSARPKVTFLSADKHYYLNARSPMLTSTIPPTATVNMVDEKQESEIDSLPYALDM